MTLTCPLLGKKEQWAHPSWKRNSSQSTCWMQGKEKYPVVRQTFTTPIRLLPSLVFLRAGLGQFLFKTCPSQIKQTNQCNWTGWRCYRIINFPHFKADQEKDTAITESAPANPLVTSGKAACDVMKIWEKANHQNLTYSSYLYSLF